MVEEGPSLRDHREADPTPPAPTTRILTGEDPRFAGEDQERTVRNAVQLGGSD